MTEGQTNDFLRDIVELRKRQKSGIVSGRKGMESLVVSVGLVGVIMIWIQSE